MTGINTPDLRLVACIVADGSVLPGVMEMVQLSDLKDAKARRIYRAALDLAGDNKPIDETTLADASGEHELIADLLEANASGATWKYWAERVIHEAQRSKLQAALRKALSEVEDGDADVDGIISSIVQDSARAQLGKPKMVDIATAATEAVKASEEAHKAGDIPGAPTGFHKLDDMIGGLRPGRLMTIAGVTGSGKSSLAINIALSAARSGRRVLVFSLEMSATELAHRMASQICSLDSHAIAKGRLTPVEWKRYIDACDQLSKLGDGLLIRSGTANSTTIAGELMRMETLGQRPDVVILDHLQLATSTEKGDSVYQKTCRLTGALKQASLDHNISIVALSQFNRQVADGRPRLYHLRDSGSIEQDSDNVLFIWHKDEGDCRLLLEKNRSGPTGEIAVRWIAHLTKFADVMPGKA